jgi:DNA-binding transcriptional ArsR family regulator
VGDIAKSMKVSRPAVSQGLKILMDANLVEQEPRGRKMYYRLKKRGFEYLETFVEGVLYVIEEYGDKEPGE